MSFRVPGRFAPVAIGAVLAACALAVGLAPGAGAAAGRPDHRAAECQVPGTPATIDQLWRPDMSAAIRYADSRVGDIAFAVRTDDRFYGYRADHVEWSASVVKAMLMVAYLDEPWVADRPIDAYDNSLLIPMVTWSDNDAATEVATSSATAHWSARPARRDDAVREPRRSGARRRSRRATRRCSSCTSTAISSPRHRRYGMHLLASVIPAERWGIGEVAPAGWTLYFKGGWGYGTGLLDHQVVLLKRGCARVAIAVLTMYDGSHLYGKATLRGIFARLLRGFPTHFPAAHRAHGARAVHGTRVRRRTRVSSGRRRVSAIESK